MRQVELKRFLFCFYLLTVAVLFMQIAYAGNNRTPAVETNKPAAAKSLLKYIPGDTARLNEVLRFYPLDGHEFNLDAPNDCAGGKFAEAKKSRMECQVTELGPKSVSLFVCDEKKTFCTQETHTITVVDASTAAALADASSREATTAESDATTVTDKVATKAAATAKKTGSYSEVATKKAPLAKKKVPGFLLSLPIAKYLAKKKGELLLINFSSEGCPPCERLQKEVFPTQKFQEATKNITKAYVDAYDLEAQDLIAKFDFYWTPTLVVTTPDYQEIGRFSGFHKTEKFLQKLAEYEENRKEPIAAAIQKLAAQKKTPLAKRSKELAVDIAKRQRRVGLWYYYSRKYEESLDYLVGYTDEEAREAYLDASLTVAKRKEDWKSWANFFKKYDREFGQEYLGGLSYMLTGVAHKHLKEEIFDKYAPKYMKRVQAAIANYDAEKSRYKKTRLVSYKNAVEKKLNEKVDEKKGMQEYLAALESQESPETEKDEISRKYSKAWAVLEMGNKADAKEIVNSVLTDYADNYNALSRGIYYYEKKFEDKQKAYDLAKKALAAADSQQRQYGMKLRVASLAFDLDKKDEARRLVNDVIATIQLPKWAGSWIHSTLSQARKIEAKLDGRHQKVEKKEDAKKNS